MAIDRNLLRMKFGGKCAYCGCDLPEKGWHADHVEPIVRKMKRNPLTHRYETCPEAWYPERNTESNLFPACAPCNNYKHRQSLEDFRGAIARQIEMLRKHSMNFRTAERYGMLTVAATAPVVFWFERYNKKPLEFADVLLGKIHRRKIVSSREGDTLNGRDND